MKKLITLILAAAMIFSLAACGKTTVELDKTELTFTAAGETATLTAETKGELTWTSSDEAVATVDQSGVVTAVAPGTATITATAGEVSAACTVKCEWVNPVDLDEFYNEMYNTLYPLDAEGNVTGPYAEDLANPNPEYGMTEEDIAMQIEMYYPGLLELETEQLHLYIPMMSFSAYEVVLVELSNESDVDALKTILQTRVDSQAAGGAWYPEAVEGWVNNARIVSNGCYVMLAVGPDCDAFVDAFNGKF